MRIGLIAVSALIGIVALRIAVNVGVRHVVEHRSASTGGRVPPAEVQGRVRTVGQLIVRIGAAVILVIAALMISTSFAIITSGSSTVALAVAKSMIRSAK